MDLPINATKFLTILLVVILCGCAAKQEQQINLEPAAVTSTPTESTHLSVKEISAFESTGHIDKNIPNKAKENIIKEYTYYLRQGRDTMCAINKRSGPYLAYAKKIFREQGMPEELANLAIVESGYRPTIVSKAGAAGAWQFMPETGLKYGLVQDAWQDERLDPYRATEAAALYLKKLYGDFGDWPTAIAAYNAGEGKLQRAKAQSGAKDFFEVVDRNQIIEEKNQLREETQNYVPRFLAISKIMRNLNELGFEPIAETEGTLSRCPAAPGTDLKALSKACNLNWEEFIANNKHHKRTITCTDRVTNIYVPMKAKELVAGYLCGDKPGYAGWKFVKVSGNGDSLEKISKRTKVPLERLQAANPGLGKLKVGQFILAPSQIGMPEKAILTAKNVPIHKDSVCHIIREKDTLFSIAKKYNIDIELLMTHNNIDNPSSLIKGQELRIPSESPIKGGSTGKIGKRAQKTYVVKSKDNLWKIARMHNISVGDLKRWNNVDEKSLKPGAPLIVSEQ